MGQGWAVIRCLTELHYLQETGATDAFQRLVKAYQNLLKYAKQS